MGRKKLGWGHGLDLSGSGQGQVAGSYECGNEPSGSIKCMQLFGWLVSWLVGWLVGWLGS